MLAPALRTLTHHPLIRKHALNTLRHAHTSTPKPTCALTQPRICMYACTHTQYTCSQTCALQVQLPTPRKRAHMSHADKSELVEACSHNCSLTFTPHLSRLSLNCGFGLYRFTGVCNSYMQ